MIHGTARMVATGCLCNLCVLVRETAPRRQAARTSVPAGAVGAHVAALRDSGWSYAALAEATGYHQNTLRGLAQGRTLFTSRYIAEDILSVRLKEVAA